MTHRVPKATGSGQHLAATLAVAPALLVILGCLVLPMATLFRYSLNRFTPRELMTEALTAENYIRFATEPYFQEVLLTTLVLALVCTLSALVLGFPVAYLLARSRSRFKSVILIVVLFPLLIGNVVRAAGWMAMLGRRGLLNVSLEAAGLVEQPVEFLFTPMAVYVGLLGVMLPFMILTLQGVLEGIDYTLVDAAQNLGASPSRAFRKVVVPLAIPGVAAGCVLVFMLAMNAYATPFLLGGPAFKMMSPALYRQISVISNWPFGAALAFVLIAVTFVATTASTYVLGRQRWRA